MSSSNMLNERKKSEEFRELLGLEPVSLMIKKSRLRWFGHVERKDDNDWMQMEDVIQQ